jgi:penicillin-binding protein 1A
LEPSIHLEERRERRGRRIPALATLAVITLLGASVYGLFGFMETNAAFGTVLDLEEQYICDVEEMALDLPDIGSLSEVQTSDGVVLGKLTARNSQPVAFDEVPELVRNAIVATEDGKFYEHEGVDFRAILRAAMANFRSEGDGLQGGSTITQQIVKKNFLSEERTIERKICEAVIAAELERRYTKDQILEFYMNAQFFGENAYGVKAAAQEYFGKELEDLTIAEAATIMIPIRNPTIYNIRKNPDTVIERRNSVIDEMEDNGFITATEAAEAKAEPLAPIPHEDFEQLAPQVIIAARQEILNNPAYGLGDTYSERYRSLFGCPAEDTECAGGGGLTVTVTVDYELQQEANRILKSWFRDETGPTGAIAMVDNATGAVRVMASGIEFGTDIEAGQRPYDLATEGRRQAGSAFKPIALLTALENGSQEGWPITLGTYWDARSPQRIDCGYPCAPDGGNIWNVRNAGGSKDLATLEQATYNSYNTVYAQVSNAVGPENIVEMAHRIGIESPLNPVLSIALGTQSVSPLEMASAYSTIANYGAKVDSYLIERIEDKQGNVVYQHEVDREQVLDPALTAAAVGALKKVVSGGTATRAQIGRPQAGKTGTAQDFRDVWFMGFIPQLTTAVWVGYADAQVEMVNFTVFNDATQKNQGYSRAYGGTLAAPIWKQFMEYVVADLPEVDFPEAPDGTSAYYRVPNTTVPNVLGRSKGSAVDLIHKAGLFSSFVPVASSQPEGTLLSQNPRGGATVRQGSRVVVLISSGQPPVMIDLRGLDLGAVDARIADFNAETGLNVSWQVANRPTDDPDRVGKVVGQDPRPGQVVGFQQVVTVYIGVLAEEPPPDDDGGGDDG